MKSTADFHDPPPYIGADLTDRHAQSRRPVDVCGLQPDSDGTLTARLWTWTWPTASDALDVESIVTEVRSARVAMLDGPQALAAPGSNQRACERACGAPGKTPDNLRPSNRPFSGYLRSSVELFGSLYRSGIPISPSGFIGGVSEYYPGDAWRRLVGDGLAKKGTDQGRQQRRLILETLGVTNLPARPSHDQNDACLGAVMAAAADDCVPGLSLVSLGQALQLDPNGALREGLIAAPAPEGWLVRRLGELLGSQPIQTPSARRSDKSISHRQPSVTPQEPLDRAHNFLKELVAFAQNSRPVLCTYAHAYRRLFNASGDPWSQAYSRMTLDVARATTPIHLPKLGPVRLDTFIVSSRQRRPADGHWSTVDYGEDEWNQLFQNAEVLR